MNKKALILLPALMVVLASCNSNSASNSESSKSTSQTSTTSEVTVDLKSPLEFDFVNDYENLKAGFPYVSDATTVNECTLGDLPIKSAGVFVSSYNSVGYLMLKSKSKDEYVGAPVFFASAVSLGKITQIEFTTGASASPKAQYKVTFSKTAIEAPDTTDAETVANGTTKTFTPSDDESYGYFAITSASTSANGQLASLKITFEK